MTAFGATSRMTHSFLFRFNKCSKAEQAGRVNTGFTRQVQGQTLPAPGNEAIYANSSRSHLRTENP
jgi:hypothetical protein